MDNPTTLDNHGRGPYSIIQVYANGTVTFQQTMHTTEQINIQSHQTFSKVKGFPLVWESERSCASIQMYIGLVLYHICIRTQ